MECLSLYLRVKPSIRVLDLFILEIESANTITDIQHYLLFILDTGISNCEIVLQSSTSEGYLNAEKQHSFHIPLRPQ